MAPKKNAASPATAVEAHEEEAATLRARAAARGEEVERARDHAEALRRRLTAATSAASKK